jgi:ligand-binding sensor domain-containing protein
MKKRMRLFAFVFGILGLVSCEQNTPAGIVDYGNLLRQDTVSSYVPKSMVRNVKLDRKGNVLVASYDAVFSYDGKVFRKLTSEIGAPSFWDVLEDRKGNLWLGSKDSGVYCYNGSGWVHYTRGNGLANNGVFKIYEDRAGNIWFGTHSGASRFDGKGFRHFNAKDGFTDEGVSNILEDKGGKIWFGTRGSAYIYDGVSFRVCKNKDGQDLHNVWALAEDNLGNVWLGGSILEKRNGDTLFLSPGIWRYDGTAFEKVAKRGATALLFDRNGNMWATGPDKFIGLSKWSLSMFAADSLFSEELSAGNVFAVEAMLCNLLEDKAGNIWFGSSNGVYRYDGVGVTNFKGE